jgi:hypothetical protein
VRRTACRTGCIPLTRHARRTTGVLPPLTDMWDLNDMQIAAKNVLPPVSYGVCPLLAPLALLLTPVLCASSVPHRRARRAESVFSPAAISGCAATDRARSVPRELRRLATDPAEWLLIPRREQPEAQVGLTRSLCPPTLTGPCLQHHHSRLQLLRAILHRTGRERGAREQAGRGGIVGPRGRERVHPLCRTLCRTRVRLRTADGEDSRASHRRSRSRISPRLPRRGR